MKPTLAFDCSMHAVSAAVVREGRVVARFEPCQSGQAERLLPLIEAVLAEANCTFMDLGRLAVTLGPGGFTGTRVGLAAARGIVLATGAEAVGMSSLELIARDVVGHPTCPVDGVRLAVVAAAGRDGFYRQTFSAKPFTVLGPPELILPDNLAHGLAAEETVLVGPGAIAYRDQLARDLRVRTAFDDVQPRAEILAKCAHHLTPAAELRPIYLRAADAKPQVGKALQRAVE